MLASRWQMKIIEEGNTLKSNSVNKFIMTYEKNCFVFTL